MFARPSPTMATPAYRPTTSLGTTGRGSLGDPVARWQRLDTRRDGCVERTVVTSDGVRLAVRDYGSAGACDHTVVLLHGLCLTQASWANEIRQMVRRWITPYESSPTTTVATAVGPARGTNRRSLPRRGPHHSDVEGPLTLAGHSMGGMTALAYLGRPAVDRPVEPHGLVLIATAAGRIPSEESATCSPLPPQGCCLNSFTTCPEALRRRQSRLSCGRCAKPLPDIPAKPVLSGTPWPQSQPPSLPLR